MHYEGLEASARHGHRPACLLISHTFRNGHIRAPIRRIHAILQKPVKSRPRPLPRRSNIPMLDRVEMDVVHVILVVLFITDAMLPESLLPEGHILTISFAKGLRELPFDDGPTARIVGVYFIQGPNAMNMIRKQDPGVDSERMMGSTVLDCVAKTGSCRFGCKQPFATGSNNREKPGPSEIISPIPGHVHLYGGPWPPHDVGHGPTYLLRRCSSTFADIFMSNPCAIPCRAACGRRRARPDLPTVEPSRRSGYLKKKRLNNVLKIDPSAIVSLRSIPHPLSNPIPESSHIPWGNQNQLTWYPVVWYGRS